MKRFLEIFDYLFKNKELITCKFNSCNELIKLTVRKLYIAPEFPFTVTPTFFFKITFTEKNANSISFFFLDYVLRNKIKLSEGFRCVLETPIWLKENPSPLQQGV